jgi:hypothetical protein
MTRRLPVSQTCTRILFALLVLLVFFAAITPTAQAQTATLTPASRALGSAAVGSLSTTTGTFTLRNTGTAVLTATSISASGDFATTSTCPSVAAAGRCTITVTFTPSAIGARTGTLTVIDSAGTQTASLTGTGTAPITITPATHGFGSVAVGTTTAATTFTVKNAGTTAIAGLSVASSNALFNAATNTCTSSLAGGGTCTVGVTFAPTATGAQTGSITATYTGLGSPVSATVTGTGVAPITITPTSHNFGSVGEGTTSAASTFTVKNTETAAVALTITTAAPFAVTGGTCGASVAASSTCTISATFAPTAAAAQSGSIVVAFTGTGSPVTLALSGTGVSPITITPTSRAFGNVTQGTTSAAKTFTVKNNTTTAMPLTVTSSNTEFPATGCTASLAAAASCTLSATFAPTATASGAQTGTIAVAYTGTGSPQSVSLTGTAVSPLTVSPTSISFSTTRNVGTPSQPHSVTLTNGTTAAIAIGTIAASPAAYAITANTCTTSLAAAASCTVTVVFTPAVVGTTTGTLTIPNGASNSQLVVAMTGGAQISNLRSIAVTVPSPTLVAGLTEQLTATGTYASGTTGNVTSVANWTTSNSKIASVSAAGLVTGVGAGTATITAAVTETGGTIVTSPAASVAVTSKTITAVTVSAPAASIYPFGTDQFSATAAYSDGTSAPVTATFASSNTGVATINSTSGLATGVLSAAGGTTNITATVSGAPVSAPFVLAVAGVQSVAVTPASPTFPLGMANSALPFGPTNNQVQFSALATYTDGTTANVTSTATWQSSPAGVAGVNTAGLATVTGQGATTVTATYGAAGSTLLTVQAPIFETLAACVGAYPSTNCSSSGAATGNPTTPLGLNGTVQLSAVATYSDGSTQNATNTVAWVSTNSSLVTVNATGLATAIGFGTVSGTEQAAAIAVYATSSLGTGYTGSVNANTVFIAENPAIAISCPSPTIDMKILVVNNAEANAGAGYADFPAIQQILNYVGTPYDVVDVTAAPPTLSDGACHGHYQGVIFAYGGDYYSIAPWQQALISYEQTFGVRQLNWYGVPDPNFGLSSSATPPIPSTGTETATFTTAAQSIFFYANTKTPLTITNASVDLAIAAPAAGGSLTPLLQDASNPNNIISAVYVLNGQQFLSQTFDSNANLTHDLVLAYGLLNWVTKGVFLGDYHVFATQSIDDFFIDDSEWIPSTTCLTNLVTKDRTLPDASNLPVFRLDAADMAQLVAWQQQKQSDPLLSQFKLTIALNGVGTTGNGDWTGLTAPIISSSATGGVATFTAQDFSGLPGQSVTVTNVSNGGTVLDGTWTIASVTSATGSSSTNGTVTTPGTATFTVNITSTETLATATENGVSDNPATATAAVADDLVSNLQNYQGAFHWISHTFDHPSTLNGLCKSVPNNPGTCGDTSDAPNYTDDIDLEILTNRWVASDPAALGSWMLDTDGSDVVQQLKFTDFNPANIVTPGVTGLNDPNVPTYLFQDGIQYAVSDFSVIGLANNGPNPSPNVGIVSTFNGVASGIYEVPRRPNDVFYNVANWADDQAEFVCIYQNYVEPTAPAGTAAAPDPPFNAYSASQILDFTSSIFVTNMLMGDMDPEMFHQPDLHFSDNSVALTTPGPTPLTPVAGAPFPPVPVLGVTAGTPHMSSLLTDTYDLTFAKYEALYLLPVLTPTQDQMGLAMQSRNSYNLSGVTASISGAPGSQTISLTVTNAATIPVTGLSVSGLAAQTGLGQPGFEVYGGQSISHINMTPGTTSTYPVQ